jgi:hypothetical protein
MYGHSTDIYSPFMKVKVSFKSCEWKKTTKNYNDLHFLPFIPKLSVAIRYSSSRFPSLEEVAGENRRFPFFPTVLTLLVWESFSDFFPTHRNCVCYDFVTGKVAQKSKRVTIFHCTFRNFGDSLYIYFSQKISTSRNPKLF